MMPTPGSPPLVVRFPAHVAPSADDFFDFWQANPNVRIERNAEGDVIVMTPAGGESGRRNAEIVRQLSGWARTDGTGVVFDSSTGFTLPNGAVRSPDASWVTRERLAGLTRDQREKFLPLCLTSSSSCGHRATHWRTCARRWRSTSPTERVSDG